ncbi:hypothetical protein CRYUN_Cryun35bG0051700 [Craigia yunnanensis]
MFYILLLLDPPGWSRRVRFALQVAKAAQALHSANPPVIHWDIKSSNILIDQSCNARLGDFGLALRSNMEDVRVKYKPPAGTLGGRHAIDLNYSPMSVVDWAVPLIKGGYFALICDGRVWPTVDKDVIHSLAALAARCMRSSVEKLLGMVEVVECLMLARKRVHAGPVSSNLWRRVKHVDKSLVKNQVFEGSE